MKRIRLQDLLLIVLPIATVLLELLPYGVALNFGRPSETGEIGWFRETYSYFSLMPYGYGSFGPMLSAILTCVTVAVVVLSMALKRNWTKAVAILCTVAAFASISPLLLGLRYFTVLGVIITLLLVAEVVLALRLRHE